MAKGHGRAPSQRQLRVGEELRHALATVMERHELRDPRLAAVDVTITEVSVSPDLKNARAYVAVLGKTASEEVVAALDHAAPYLRRRIGELVQLRFLPALRFAADPSFDYADHIDGLLRQVELDRGDGA